MKVLAVSDRVLDQLYVPDVRARYPDIEMVIGCGDLPFYYLDFLVSALNVPLLYVRGNHDRTPQYSSDGRVVERVRGAIDLHGKVAKSNGLLLAGLEGSMRYRPKALFMYTEPEMRRQVWRLVPRLIFNRIRHGRYLDILVAHSPPFGIHDRDDIPHTGFKVFLEFMHFFRPRYLLHGHIHAYRSDRPWRTSYENTEVINVYPYKLLELEFDA